MADTKGNALRALDWHYGVTIILKPLIKSSIGIFRWNVENLTIKLGLMIRVAATTSTRQGKIHGTRLLIDLPVTETRFTPTPAVLW